MKLHALAVIIAAGLASASAAADSTAETTDGNLTANLPAQPLTRGILYQYLLAELAAGRGEFGLATSAYTDLSFATRDPRIVKRATEVALYAKRYDAALKLATLWAGIDPKSEQARHTLLSLQATVGETQDLESGLSTQLASSGEDLGNQLLQLNRWLTRHPDKKAALDLVIRLTAPYLGVAEAHFARAQAAHGAGDTKLAKVELDQALQLRPDWEQAVLARAQVGNDQEESVRVLAPFVAGHPKAKDARMAYGRSLAGTKRYPEARKVFQSLLADFPDNGDVVYAVALLSLQLDDTQEGETQLKRLVSMGHGEADNARLYLGQIEEARKQPDAALRWYSEIEEGTHYQTARMRMARVLVQQQRLEDARKILQETAATSPTERAQLQIAESQLLRDAGRYADAYAVLAAGLKSQPDQSDLLYEAAIAAEKAGKPEVIEPHLRRVIALKPDQAHAYNALGYSLADRNERLDEAQQLIDKALSISPDDPFILDSKGWVLFRRGDLSGALSVLQSAFAKRADPEIAAHLGEVLWSLGRKDEARQTWDQATKANPDNDVLANTLRKFQP